MALVMGLGLTSCMDDDWKAPSGDTPAYGNNTLQEKNVISIAELKEKYGITIWQTGTHLSPKAASAGI